ncbi:unnamed protein product [Rhizophagus irregularis]|uniref:Uncharacterized protein n=1 Tax=Rhizophagus irregularis TaxID=588596 RepID=A0A915Z3L3_9GLOM|nr:unnamed protein product [Rhizophagus irregularis]CAB5116397.1 unnamed protein product [Rhizophagus irregularis]CAB5359855.1 unnamed protein product [Rhizophagus irregularis]
MLTAKQNMRQTVRQRHLLIARIMNLTDAIKLKKKSVKKNGKEVKEVTKKKSTKKKTEQGSRSKTKDNGVKNNNGVKNGQLPENTHAVDLVFDGDARYKRQPIGLRQNNLALNHAIKAYQKAQSSNHEGSGDSKLHKTQLCKSSVICYPKAPNDMASICCKIDTEIISYAVIDTGSDSSIISQNISEKR